MISPTRLGAPEPRGCGIMLFCPRRSTLPLSRIMLGTNPSSQTSNSRQEPRAAMRVGDEPDAAAWPSTRGPSMGLSAVHAPAAPSSQVVLHADSGIEPWIPTTRTLACSGRRHDHERERRGRHEANPAPRKQPKRGLKARLPPRHAPLPPSPHPPPRCRLLPTPAPVELERDLYPGQGLKRHYRVMELALECRTDEVLEVALVQLQKLIGEWGTPRGGRVSRGGGRETGYSP